MKNRLPLPIKTIKIAQLLLDEHSDNLNIRNPLKNVLAFLGDYDYDNAINTLQYLQIDFPELLHYKHHIKAIQSAKKRYLSTPLN